MGCGPSINLDAFLINQPKPDAELIDGLASQIAPVKIKTGGGAYLVPTNMVHGTPIKLLQEGKLVATLEKKNTVIVVKDPAGKIVALFDENGAGDYENGATANSFVYCSKPRHEGQSSARTFEGTPLFMWAGLGPAVSVRDVNNGVSMVLKPIRLTHPNGWLDEQEPNDTRLRWGQFGCYNVAADGVSFESTPSLVLQGKDPFTPVRVTSQIEMGAILDLSCSQGIGFVPVSKDSLTVAAGVDPLMVVLAFLACGIGNGGFLDRRPAGGMNA